MENLVNEEIEHMIHNSRKGEKIIQQEEQTGKIKQENYEPEPETKEIKAIIIKKIEHMKTEE